MATLMERLAEAWHQPYEVVVSRYHKGGDLLLDMELAGDTGELYEQRRTFWHAVEQMCKAKYEEQQRGASGEQAVLFPPEEMTA